MKGYWDKIVDKFRRMWDKYRGGNREPIPKGVYEWQ